MRSLEPRIAAHRAALRGRLSAALTAALAPAAAPPGTSNGGANGGANGGGGGGPRNTAAALHALHAAADLGEAEAAEGAVRRVVVAPLVDRLIAEHKAHGWVQAGWVSGRVRGWVPGSCGSEEKRPTQHIGLRWALRLREHSCGLGNAFPCRPGWAAMTTPN